MIGTFLHSIILVKAQVDNCMPPTYTDLRIIRHILYLKETRFSLTPIIPANQLRFRQVLLNINGDGLYQANSGLN